MWADDKKGRESIGLGSNYLTTWSVTPDLCTFLLRFFLFVHLSLEYFLVSYPVFQYTHI